MYFVAIIDNYYIQKIRAIELTRKLLVGCKHRASEGVFYIGGRGFLCQIIEPVTFSRCAFIIARRSELSGLFNARIFYIRPYVVP